MLLLEIRIQTRDLDLQNGTLQLGLTVGPGPPGMRPLHELKQIKYGTFQYIMTCHVICSITKLCFLFHDRVT